MDPKKLVGSYRRALRTDAGMAVMKDLAEFSEINTQAGSDLTHSECAYRNAKQDFYRYIEAMIADDN